MESPLPHRPRLRLPKSFLNLSLFCLTTPYWIMSDSFTIFQGSPTTFIRKHIFGVTLTFIREALPQHLSGKRYHNIYQGSVASTFIREALSQHLSWKRCPNIYQGSVASTFIREALPQHLSGKRCHNNYQGNVATTFIREALPQHSSGKRCLNIYQGKFALTLIRRQALSRHFFMERVGRCHIIYQTNFAPDIF